MKKLSLTICTSVLITGCATSSKDIGAAYVSPIQYQSYDCEQLAAEDQRLKARVSQLGGRLDEANQNDKAIGVVGAILFWPALFALGGTKTQEAEYARLKGEHDALQQAYIMKKCGATKTQEPAKEAGKDAQPLPATTEPSAPAPQPATTS